MVRAVLTGSLTGLGFDLAQFSKLFWLHPFLHLVMMCYDAVGWVL